MPTTRTRRGAALLAVLCLVAPLAGCSGSGPSAGASSAATWSAGTGDPLATYTDRGDGCQQVVSTIGYADESLVPLGNEQYQDFDEVALSRLASVSGAIALEVHDFPNARVLAQADKVGPLADAASAPKASPARIRALQEFRREAAEFVILCADALATSSASPSPSG